MGFAAIGAGGQASGWVDFKRGVTEDASARGEQHRAQVGCAMQQSMRDEPAVARERAGWSKRAGLPACGRRHDRRSAVPTQGTCTQHARARRAAGCSAHADALALGAGRTDRRVVQAQAGCGPCMCDAQCSPAAALFGRRHDRQWPCTGAERASFSAWGQLAGRGCGRAWLSGGRMDTGAVARVPGCCRGECGRALWSGDGCCVAELRPEVGA